LSGRKENEVSLEKETLAILNKAKLSHRCELNAKPSANKKAETLDGERGKVGARREVTENERCLPEYSRKEGLVKKGARTRYSAGLAVERKIGALWPPRTDGGGMKTKANTWSSK